MAGTSFTVHAVMLKLAGAGGGGVGVSDELFPQ